MAVTFQSGWARLAVVFVVVAELFFAGLAYKSGTELYEAGDRLAGMRAPPPEIDEGEMTTDELLSFGSDPVAIMENYRDYTARSNYELAVSERSTARNEMFLVLALMAAVPLVAFLIFQSSKWVIGGFRDDDDAEEESGYI